MYLHIYYVCINICASTLTPSAVFLTAAVWIHTFVCMYVSPHVCKVCMCAICMYKSMHAYNYACL